MYIQFFLHLSQLMLESAFNRFAVITLYITHRCNLYSWRYLHGNVIKSRSHVPGYTGNPSRSPLSFDTINLSLTSLFTELYFTECITLFYTIYLIFKLCVNDKLQTCSIFYPKKRLISKNMLFQRVWENYTFHTIIFIIFLYCSYNLFSSGKKPHISSLSQWYRWVVSLFPIVIPWCA